MTVSRFHIAGMDCAAEEQLVRMALSDVSHIDGLEFNLQQRDVLIDHAGDLGAIDSALKTLNLGANYVEDVDALAKPAIDAGVTVKKELADQFYGDRMVTLTDPYGYDWCLGTHIEDVSEEEIERRMNEMH